MSLNTRRAKLTPFTLCLIAGTISTVYSSEAFAQDNVSSLESTASAKLLPLTVPPGFIIQPSKVNVFPANMSDLETTLRRVLSLDPSPTYEMTPEKYTKYISSLENLINNADSTGKFTWLGDEGFSIAALRNLRNSLVLDPFSFALGNRPTRKIASVSSI